MFDLASAENNTLHHTIKWKRDLNALLRLNEITLISARYEPINIGYYKGYQPIKVELLKSWRMTVTVSSFFKFMTPVLS